MSQYPGKLASLAFLPNKRSHASAICEASGEARLVETWIVAPFGIPARSCLSLHSNICAIISSLNYVSGATSSDRQRKDNDFELKKEEKHPFWKFGVPTHLWAVKKNRCCLTGYGAPKRYVYGIAGIANLFGCSEPTAQRIKSSGEIDDAISQIGGIIVVDAEYALDLLRVSKKYRNMSLRKSKK